MLECGETNTFVLCAFRHLSVCVDWYICLEVMPLNYSKWDNLELSDDSDVEVHPNIDKKSFIRWKQRDIHEKRDQRKSERLALQTEVGINDTLAPMLSGLLTDTRSEGSTAYSRTVARLSAGRANRGNKDGPEGPTTDDMFLSLLLQIQQQDDVKSKQGAELDQALVANLEKHTGLLADRQTKIRFEIEQMDKEDAKKITSDTIRDGFNSGYVAKPEQPEPEPELKAKSKKKPASSSTVIETLNSPSATANDSDADNDDDDDDVRKATSDMLQFAHLPSCIPASIPLSASTVPASFDPAKQLATKPFEEALQFLSAHKALVSERSGTTDSLLLEAFDAQMAGKAKFARQCVEKSLLIQYCNKLGPDGVNLFFRRMVGSQNGKASLVYINDVLATYARIAERSKVLAAQQSSAGSEAGQEQIQLVAEDPDTVIGFEVPQGPPPEHITLEGEAASLDPEQVRAWLQRQWDIYTAFPKDLQTALQTKQLDQVNKVLGNLPVDQAEEIVGQLDQAGILSFSSSQVRDETGRS